MRELSPLQRQQTDYARWQSPGWRFAPAPHIGGDHCRRHQHPSLAASLAALKPATGQPGQRPLTGNLTKPTPAAILNA